MGRGQACGTVVQRRPQLKHLYANCWDAIGITSALRADVHDGQGGISMRRSSQDSYIEVIGAWGSPYQPPS